MNRLSQPFVYGLVTAGVIFFIGWSTGMGGSLLPNAGFSVLMGVFAGILYWLAMRYAKSGSRRLRMRRGQGQEPSVDENNNKKV